MTNFVKFRCHCLVIVFVLIFPLLANAQAVSPLVNGIQQVKPFAEFSRLEEDLLTALRSGNEKMVTKLLDPNFEYIFADKLDLSNTATQLLDVSAVNRWASCKIGSLTVRSLGDKQIVGFYLEEVVQNKIKEIWSVQDYWTKKNGYWKLRYRFISQKGVSSLLPPGYLNQEVINKRY